MNARPSVSWARAAGTSLLVWTGVLLLHSWAGYADQLRRGGQATYSSLLGGFALAYLPWVLFSAALLRVLSRGAERLGRPRWVAKIAAAFVVGYLLPQGAHQVAVAMFTSGAPWSEFGVRFLRWPAIYWLVDAGLFGLTFAVVYSWVVIQENRRTQERRLRAEAENQTLRLQTLRGQLEPHFLFNSLNAISGLVRSDDKTLALTALQRLSTLLRYALEVSGRTWVTLGEELAFTREYVTLQRLRYGDRLGFVVASEFDDESVRSLDCPPLLLQPLIENAIRHDLETHEGPSEIRLTVRRRGEALILEVANTIHPDAAPNPGAGLGLPTLRARLALLYVDTAVLTTHAEADCFVVTLVLPERKRPPHA